MFILCLTSLFLWLIILTDSILSEKLDSRLYCYGVPGEEQGRVPGLPAAPALLAGCQLGLGAPGPVLVLAIQQLFLHFPGDLIADLDLAVELGHADPQGLNHLPVEGLAEGANRHKLVVLRHDRRHHRIVGSPRVICHP